MSWNHVRAIVEKLFGERKLRKQPIRKCYRPQLLGYEERVMPATLTWVGNGVGDGALWSVNTNWSPAQRPVNGDTLNLSATRGANTSSTMDLGGGVQYHIGQLNLLDNFGGTITLNSDLYVDVLNMRSAGTITGSNTLNIYQRTNNPVVGAATIFATSFWTDGTISTSVLRMSAENNHRATLQLGDPNTTPNLRATFFGIDAFSTVNWQAGSVTVAGQVTVSNFGTFRADSARGTMGNNLGAGNQWTFENDTTGVLFTAAGRFTNMIPSNVRGGRTIQTASITPGANTFEIVGDFTQDDATSAVSVESGTLLITGSFTQSGGDVTVSAGTSLTVTNTYTASGGTIEDYGSLTASNGLQLQSGTTFSGSGTVVANVSNAGTFVTGAADGSSPGTISITGNYTQTAGSTTVNGELDVSGTFEEDGGTVTVPQSSHVFSAGAFTQTGGDFQIYFTNSCSITGNYTMSGGTAEFFYSGGTFGGQMALNGGTFELSSTTTMTVSGGLSIGSLGTLEVFGGTNTIAGNVTNGGTLIVGAGDTFAVSGNYTQTASGKLTIEADSGSGYYGHLSVTGTATLAGTFVFDMPGGYSGYPGANFDLISYGSHSGTFATLTLPTLTNPYSSGWSAQYGANDFSLTVV
jgi:hypothetical protein